MPNPLADGMKNSKNGRHSNQPPPKGKYSDVRPAAPEHERRLAGRWHSDAEVEILSPIQQVASAVALRKTGIQLSLDHWLSAGTVCDLRITTHSGRMMVQPLARRAAIGLQGV